MTRALSQTAETATVVCAASDGKRQHVVARVRHAGDHVSDISAPHDRERVAIHCAVVDSSRLVIARIICGDDRAAYISKIIERDSRADGGCACCGHEDQHSPTLLWQRCGETLWRSG